MAIWKLYWVKSDGYEDCFVVAENNRSAKCVEVNMNGFAISDIEAVRIMDIPDGLEEKANVEFVEWSKIHAPQQAQRPDLRKWPGYADRWLLEELGAQFRVIEEEEQMLLRDVVYARRPNGERYKYSIGPRALLERNKNLPPYDNYANEPNIDICAQLYAAMGLALTQCHGIELLFSKSFIFGVSKKQKRKYETLNDFFAGWEKKTLGGMFSAMQEAFDLEPEIQMAFDLFLDMRNRLVHGITKMQRYDINTDWGQRELVAFLDLFLCLCGPMRDIAASCLETSLELANTHLLASDAMKIPIESPDELRGLFAHCFKLGDGRTVN